MKQGNSCTLTYIESICEVYSTRKHEAEIKYLSNFVKEKKRALEFMMIMSL